MLIAQITDQHLKPEGRLAYKLADTAPFLQHSMERPNALLPRPDVVPAAGDLVDGAAPQKYAQVA